MKLRLLLMSFFLCATAFAQRDKAYYLSVVKAHPGDTTEVNALNELYQIFRTSDSERAKGYLDRAMRLARKIDYNDGQAHSYRLYGIYYNMKGNFERAEEMLEKAKERFERSGNQMGLVSCLNGLANLKTSKGQYAEALSDYLRTAELNDSMDNQSGLSMAYHNIGALHLRMSQYDKALSYLNKSLTIKKTLGTSTDLLVTYNAIGASYGGKGDSKRALTYLVKAEKLAESTGNTLEQGNILNNIGTEYFVMGDFENAEIYFMQSLQCYRQMGRMPEIPLALSNIGLVHLMKGEGEIAIAYHDSSLVLAREIGATGALLPNYEGLANAYALIGDYKSAYEWYVKFHELSDSLSGAGVKDHINELQAKYDSGRKDLRIAQLETKEAESEAAAANSKILILVLVFTVLILISWLVYYLNRRKIREKLRFKELEQKALRAQMNPHFIFNSLNSIQRMYIEGREDTANDYMADFARLLRSILENSGKSTITLNEEWEITKLYLDLEQLRTDNQFTYTLELDPEINPLEAKIPPLVLQPYVENAIWHGIMPKNGMGHIGIRIKSDNGNKLYCEITDDGVGYGNSNKNTGFPKSGSKGMEITAERLGGSGQVHIESGEEGGTKITLIIDKAV